MASGRVGFSEKLSQRASLAPGLQHGLEMLTIPASELTSKLLEMTESNPLLEVNYEHPLFSAGVSLDGAFASTVRREDGAASSKSESFDLDRVGAISDSFGLVDYVHMQLSGAASCSPATAYILDALDDDGYFRGSIEDICDECGVPKDDAWAVLDEVRSSYPRGIGAFDLRDCLLLQLGSEAGVSELARTLVEHYLDEIPKGHPGALARKLGVSRADVAEAISLITACDPHPGRSFCRGRLPEYIYPDLTLVETEAEFAISVVGSSLPPLVLDKEYLAMLADPEKHKSCAAYLAEMKQSADEAMRNVEYRYRTLARIGNYILKNEYTFFVRRGKGVVPLATAAAAEALEVHPSTISRAIAHKYLSTPFGTFPLKMFFSSSYEKGACEDGSATYGVVSSVDVKHRIKELIEDENHLKPLSDNSIAKLFKSEGVDVSRRTIAKYRESMGIPASSERRTALA